MMPPGRLLLIKPSSFGDIVNALPALETLYRSWPQTRIDWIVKPEWAQLLENHPMLHDLLLFPRNRREWFERVRDLRIRRYDMTIDLQGLLRSGLLGLMSGAPVRVGFANAREGSRWCYTHRIATTGGVIHAVERHLQLLSHMGLSTNGVRNFPLPQRPEADEWFKQLCVQEGIHPRQPVCVIHPATRRVTKQWPIERFAELVVRLIRDPACRVVLVSGRAEAQQTEGLRRQVEGRVIDLSGKTTLPQLAPLLRRATVLVTNDSGPMHLAAAGDLTGMGMWCCKKHSIVHPVGATRA
jgi:ADP-heptose:LPS heptosyltransferase